MRRIGMFLAVALFIGAGWTSTANAALGFFKVNVDLVGLVSENLLEFRLTDTKATPAFTFKRFKTTSSPVKKAMLATALTAMAAGVPVFVLTDPDDGIVPEVFRIYLASE